METKQKGASFNTTGNETLSKYVKEHNIFHVERGVVGKTTGFIGEKARNLFTSYYSSGNTPNSSPDGSPNGKYGGSYGDINNKGEHVNSSNKDTSIIAKMG